MLSVFAVLGLGVAGICWSPLSLCMMGNANKFSVLVVVAVAGLGDGRV